MPLAIAYARLVVTGGDSHRLHEEIITAGGELREGRFKRLGVRDVQAALDSALPTEPGDAVKKRLAELWPQMAGPLAQALEARMKDRAEGVCKLLEERRWQETQRIGIVMNELMKAIEQELHEPEIEQLPLFSSEEREQWTANADALRRRLAQIPGELEKEQAAITARYANPTPRLFPVAVTFLVPKKLA